MAQHRLPRAAVQPPSLEGFERWVDVALGDRGNLGEWLKLMILKGFSRWMILYPNEAQKVQLRPLFWEGICSPFSLVSLGSPEPIIPLFLLKLPTPGKAQVEGWAWGAFNQPCFRKGLRQLCL